MIKVRGSLWQKTKTDNRRRTIRPYLETRPTSDSKKIMVKRVKAPVSVPSSPAPSPAPASAPAADAAEEDPSTAMDSEEAIAVTEETVAVQEEETPAETEETVVVQEEEASSEPELPPEDKSQIVTSPIEAEEIEKEPPRKRRRRAYQAPSEPDPRQEKSRK